MVDELLESFTRWWYCRRKGHFQVAFVLRNVLVFDLGIVDASAVTSTTDMEALIDRLPHSEGIWIARALAWTMVARRFVVLLATVAIAARLA